MAVAVRPHAMSSALRKRKSTGCAGAEGILRKDLRDKPLKLWYVMVLWKYFDRLALLSKMPSRGTISDQGLMVSQPRRELLRCM